MPRYSGLFGNIHGQEEQRRVETFLDQHGREYTANIEITTGDPCTALMPIGWTAPTGPEWFRGLLMPPDHLRQMVHRQERARKRYQIEINYRQWLEEIDKRDEDWDMRLLNLAQSSTKGAGFTEMMDNPPPKLLEYMGSRAFPPRVFVEAMAAGDKWSLGLSDRVPKAALVSLRDLEPYITKRRPARDGVLVNPFADEDDEQPAVAAQLPPNPFGEDADDVDDLDELFDPEAKGGKVEKVGRRSRAER